MLDSIVISDVEAGLRLDKVLNERFQDAHSRTYFQYLIEENRVLVNGKPVKKRTKLLAGDEVEIQFILTPELKVEPEDIPLNILYEDEALIVLNKPAGMVVHPALGNWTGTLVNALLFHCKNLEGDELRPGIVHRLDKETSGVLVAAKTIPMQQKLIEMFAAREVRKEYLAICLGNPGNVTIEAPIARHPVKRKEMAVVDGGKKASSICRTLHFDGKISVVQVELITGRTHQIRVHLKHRGTPVLGDPIYGNSQSNKRYGAKRQLLHAHRLTLKHPLTGEEMTFVAEIPEDIKRYYEISGAKG